MNLLLLLKEIVDGCIFSTLPAYDLRELLGRSISPGKRGSVVEFADFCAYVRARVQPEHKKDFDKKPVSHDEQRETLRRAHGEQECGGLVVGGLKEGSFEKKFQV